MIISWKCEITNTLYYGFPDFELLSKLMFQDHTCFFKCEKPGVGFVMDFDSMF